MDLRPPAVLYDAACPFCRACAAWLHRRDRRRALATIPLQDDAAQAYLRRAGLPERDFSSLVFVGRHQLPRDDRLAAPPLLETDAVIAALAVLGGRWRGAVALKAVPRPWRDAVYRFVARHRRRDPAPRQPAAAS